MHLRYRSPLHQQQNSNPQSAACKLRTGPWSTLLFYRSSPVTSITYVYFGVAFLILVWQFSTISTMNPVFKIANGHFFAIGKNEWNKQDEDSIGGKTVSTYYTFDEKNKLNLTGRASTNEGEAKKAFTNGHNLGTVNIVNEQLDTGSAAAKVSYLEFKFSAEDIDLLRKHAVILHSSTGAKSKKPEKGSIVNNTKVIKQKTVIATVASYDIRNLVHNLMCFVHQSTVGATPVVFALDMELTSYARERNIPSIAFHPNVQVKSANETATELKNANGHERENRDGEPAFYGTQKFSGISNNKLLVVYHLLKHGYDVLLTDVDVVWCRDMLHTFGNYVNDYPSFDMFIQSNRATENGTGQLNTGFYYTRATEGTVSLFESLSVHSPKAILKGQDDQTFFWRHICRGGHAPSGRSMTGVMRYKVGPEKWETICQWNEKRAVLLFLPLAEFPNGAVRFLTHGSQGKIQYARGLSRERCHRKEVAMWHVNFVKAHMKKGVMVRNNLWISRDNGTCEPI